MSAYLFEDLGRALNKIAQKLSKNEDLCRLLTDMSETPLDKSKDYDITNPLLEKTLELNLKLILMNVPRLLLQCQFQILSQAIMLILMTQQLLLMLFVQQING